jgi:hypothetical protein
MSKDDLEFFEDRIGKEVLNEGFGYDYNIFCLQEGVKIAKACLSKESIKEFYELSASDQLLKVPDLSDSHSGNTFNMSCRFVFLYLEKIKIDNRDEKIETITNV